MATLSGAIAIGKRDFGSIEAGKRAPLLFIPLTITSGQEIEDILLFQGQGMRIKWIY